MSMFKYEKMYVDIYVKYYDEKEEKVIKREVLLDIALLIIEQMLVIKKLQWIAYRSQCMYKHAIEWIRLD